MGSPLCVHMASLCIHCDWTLNFESVNKYDYSLIPLCNKYVSDTQVVQCFQQGLCLSQKSISKPNSISRFPLLRNSTNNMSEYNCPQYIGFDSSFSSSPSSFYNCNRPISLPLYNDEDLSSYFETFQILSNLIKNYSDQVTMLQPYCLDIPKNNSCPGSNGYESTKEDIDNEFVNTFDGDESVIDEKELIPKEDMLCIIAREGKILALGMSSVLHKDYNVEALAKASSKDNYKNQVIGSLAKEEKFGIFPNALGQLDCGQSQFIVTDELSQCEKSKKHILREEAKKRYLAKKKNRKFGKKIRYVSRKSTADMKRRMKGRFTKAGEEYDYDPCVNNNINKGSDNIMS